MLPGIGIFGSGPLVGLYVRYFQNGGFPVVGLWSPSAESASALAGEHQIPTFSANVDKILLLPSVQLVVVLSSPHFHSQITAKACGIGKHVLIGNWPPAYSLAEMRGMRAAAANYPALISLLFTALRHVPALQLMRKLVLDDGLIGSVKAIQAALLCDVLSIYEEKSIVWDKFMGGGLLSLYGSNLIDVISFTTGLRARKVHAMIRTFNTLLSNHHILRNNADDFVTFQMEMYGCEGDGQKQQKISQENSVIASVTLNGLHYNHLPEHELIIYGTAGYLAYRNGNLYGKIKQVNNSNTFTTTNVENGHGSLGSNSSSGHESGTSSFSKESIFYLDEFDAAYHNHHHPHTAISTEVASSSGKTSLMSNGSGGGSLTIKNNESSHLHHPFHPYHPPPPSGQCQHLPAQLLPNVTSKWHVWPEIYQRALFHLITSLREAFFGGDNVPSSSNKRPDSPSSTVHSMFCPPPPPTLTITNSDDDVKTSSEINSGDGNSKQISEQIHWIKDPLSGAANFEDGVYIQTVIEAIKQSSQERSWIRVQDDF